ncbi:MAG: TIR domain-containing protein [Alphaproteobacteria bacterium]|nr:TIR domain-containing protein [Alphaproteobacteria bacterium]
MKVFLSWSGDKSHKVALVFRDWLPSVIQSIVPYVSSEDIDKGARWSSDIAQELEDSTFGILCVTKENLTAPWLNFEAGALSKTMDKSLVCPFLFNIKRSEVEGPVLQFQSTIFEKEDIKKLLQALNTASNPNGLSDEKLSEAFEVWYPRLEEKLKSVTDVPDDSEDQFIPANIDSYSHIFEEILDLSRTNQKLLRNPEGVLEKNLEAIKESLAEIQDMTKRGVYSRSNRKRKYHPMMIEELLHAHPSRNGYMGIQMLLSLLKDDFPWLYDTGMDLIQLFKSKATLDKKRQALDEYSDVLEFTFRHPMMREFYRPNEDMWMLGKELPHLLMKSLDRSLSEQKMAS